MFSKPWRMFNSFPLPTMIVAGNVRVSRIVDQLDRLLCVVINVGIDLDVEVLDLVADFPFVGVPGHGVLLGPEGTFRPSIYGCRKLSFLVEGAPRMPVSISMTARSALDEASSSLAESEAPVISLRSWSDE